MTNKPKDYAAITKASDFTKWVDKLIKDNKEFGFDIESGYVGPDRDLKLATLPEHPDWLFVGFSFTNGLDWARYVPVAHDSKDKNVDDPKQVARDLWRLLQTGLCVAHNVMFELHGTSRWFMEMLANDPEYGEAVKASKGMFPFKEDTMLYAFNLDVWHGQLLWEVDSVTGKVDPTQRSKKTTGKDLKSLVLLNFKHKMIEFKELFEGMNLKATAQRFNILEPDTRTVTYACEDALWCLALNKLCNEEARNVDSDGQPIPEEARFNPLTYVIDKNVAVVAVEMNKVGIPLDWDLLKRKLVEAQELKAEMNDEIMEEISDRLGEIVSINLNSPKQVAETLYDKLGIPQPVEKGEKTRSTGEKPLQSIAKEDKLVRDILTYRQVTKMIGSYIEKYIKQLDYKGIGKAYPSHNPAGALTGRFSVDGMSYQQLPKPYYFKLKNGREFHFSFRDIIKAPKDSRIVGFDYSQIQLRMMAGFAQEKNMLNAFATGIDIHTATASSMLGIPVDKVTGKQRGTGKTLNFATVFGQGADQLAQDLSTPENPMTKQGAEKELEKYFSGFPRLKSWISEKQAEGKRAYVRGLFGRRYRIWEFTSDLRGVYNKGERMAVNEPVQGAEAYYVKLAMIRVMKKIKEAGLEDKIQFPMMVHDAMEFFVHNSISDQEVIELLYDAVTFSLPEHMDGFPDMITDWHVGNTLGTIVEIELDEDKNITGYYVDIEIPGQDKVTFRGATYDEVEEPYALWRRTEHPEVLAKLGKQVKIEIPEEEEVEAKHFIIQVNVKPEQSDLKDLIEIVESRKGNNKLTLSVGDRTTTLSGRYDIDLSHQPTINLILKDVHMYEVKDES